MLRGTLDYTFSRWEFDRGYTLPECWRVLEIAVVLFIACWRVLEIARVGKGIGGTPPPPPPHPLLGPW